MRPTKHPQSALRCPLNHVLGTEANVRVLRAISLSDIPIGVSELARLTSLQASGVARVCTHLEDLGIIEAVGRGARYRQYRRSNGPSFANTLLQTFRDERSWGEETLRAIRNAVAVGGPLQAAWIEGPVATGSDGPDDAVVVGLLTEPSAAERVRNERWQQLMPLQSGRNLVIELKVLTVADLKTADARRREELEHVIPLQGPPPLDLAAVSDSPSAPRKGARDRSHGRLNARELDIARAIADRIRSDPSLIEEAQRYIERRLPSASSGERLELEEWRSILASMSISRLRRFLVQDSERATRLRQSMPFLNALSADDREAIFAAAAARK